MLCMCSYVHDKQYNSFRTGVVHMIKKIRFSIRIMCIAVYIYMIVFVYIAYVYLHACLFIYATMFVKALLYIFTLFA